MRLDFCLATLQGMPADCPAVLAENPLDALRNAGFDGVQTTSMAGIAEAGMVGIGSARISDPAAFDELARQHCNEGFLYTSLIVGNGLEDMSAAEKLCAAMLEAQARHSYPFLLETHRASMTQDIRRTVELSRRFPMLRFTADFTHWYLGHELAMGNLQAKMDFLQPVIDRVVLVEGRIGTVNCAQIPLEGAKDNRHFVLHHREFWTRCFKAILARGEEPAFAPQLLPAVIHAEGADWPIDYAQVQRGANGEWREESDRWAQTLILCEIALDCAQLAAEQINVSSSQP